MNTKNLVGLCVAGVTFASVLGSTSPAGAVNFVYGNVTYDVTTYTGTFDDLKAIITSPDNAVWENETLSFGLTVVVGKSLGLPNTIANWGPFFAYQGANETQPRVVTYFYKEKCCCCGSDNTFDNTQVLVGSTYTYAAATAVPEPFTILGSIMATGFMVAFNRIKNNNKKE
jgi:hypothetical protein